MLTKEQILSASDLKTATVDVPEWGGVLTIRTMTGADRDAFEQSTYKKNGDDYQVNMKDIRARLCASCVVDENGELVFGETDIRALSRKSSLVLDRVFSACQELNGLTGKDVEELAKNLE